MTTSNKPFLDLSRDLTRKCYVRVRRFSIAELWYRRLGTTLRYSSRSRNVKENKLFQKKNLVRWQKFLFKRRHCIYNHQTSKSVNKKPRKDWKFSVEYVLSVVLKEALKINETNYIGFSIFFIYTYLSNRFLHLYALTRIKMFFFNFFFFCENTQCNEKHWQTAMYKNISDLPT